jgi:hypothetical protein
MPVWLQHTFVLVLVAACAWVVAREALRALGRRASKMAGCGTCGGCGTNAQPTPDKSAGERVVFLPADALSARMASRYKN